MGKTYRHKKIRFDDDYSSERDKGAGMYDRERKHAIKADKNLRKNRHASHMIDISEEEDNQYNQR